MASAMIALDKCTKKNGCLQVLSGSNQIGRIDHALLESGQVGVDLRRVEEAKKHLDLIYCEMEPGDVLFFHCKVFHAAGSNETNLPKFSPVFTVHTSDNEPLSGTRSADLPSYTIW